MYLLLRHLRASQSRSWYVFVAALVVFSGLNLLENLVHYNIGRGGPWTTPDVSDLARILGVMMAFAVVNAFLMTVLIART